MAFEPRGKVAVLVNAMRAAPDKVVWPACDVAACMEVPQGNLPSYLRAAIDHELLFRKVEGGKSYFSLQRFEPAASASTDTMKIPTLGKPGAWRPPVMTPPRGDRRLPATVMEHLPPPVGAPKSDQQQLAAAPAAATSPEPDPRPEATDEDDGEPVPFDARRWLDGDIDLYGLLETDDGGHRLPADKVPQLLKLLGGVPT